MYYKNKVRIDTADYITSHGRQPRGTGAWAFFMGCRDNLDKLYCAPGRTTYAEARKLALQEALRLGVTYVSVGA